MSELLQQHCALLEQWNSNGEYQYDPGDILNDIHKELTRLQSTNAAVFREEMAKVSSLLRGNMVNIDESLLTFFFNYFLQLLKQWGQSIHFKDQNDGKTFENLVNMVVLERLDYLTNDSLINEFIQCLDSIANTGKALFTNEHIPIITSILNTYTDLESNNGMGFMERTQFDDVVVKCLCSSYTPEVFNQFKSSAVSEERTPTERFVFEGLFRYLDRMNRDKLEEKSHSLREHLLPSISDLLDAFEKTYNDWSDSSITILTNITTDFLYSVQMTLTNDIHLSTQKHICDVGIRLLVLPMYQSMKFNNNCLQYIYMGTMHDKVLDHLKAQGLTGTMFKIAALYKNETEIQFNTYRILAAIMTEEDIKRLDDPGAIAKIFLDHLEEIKDRDGWHVRIKNLLTTLKILLQHDQIRDEIYKLDGVALFIYCATTTKFNNLIQQRALENLLIMSFNDTVSKQLKVNERLMEYLQLTSENSEESELQRAANSLLWRLTKDDTSKSPTNDPTPKTVYDVMISYSHKDKDLCFDLYNRLVKDNFRVWLDRDQMHGTPLESMSNAIESSEFVFVCMSDSYKQSGYCKMEAYYALERQCCIIPLVMKSQYKPDGWLGIIVTGRMRVDFPKYGFETAYQKLMIEIGRNRKEKKQQMPMQHHEAPMLTKPSNENKETEAKKSVYQLKKGHALPTNIEQWTDDDTQQFFLKQQLENFLPICARMNGVRLAGLYKMCTSNSPVMFQSLNNQLSMAKTAENGQLIEIFEYLQFLDDLKPFVPVTPEKKEVVVPQSSACTIL